VTPPASPPPLCTEPAPAQRAREAEGAVGYVVLSSLLAAASGNPPPARGGGHRSFQFKPGAARLADV